MKTTEKAELNEFEPETSIVLDCSFFRLEVIASREISIPSQSQIWKSKTMIGFKIEP